MMPSFPAPKVSSRNLVRHWTITVSLRAWWPSGLRNPVRRSSLSAVRPEPIQHLHLLRADDEALSYELLPSNALDAWLARLSRIFRMGRLPFALGSHLTTPADHGAVSAWCDGLSSKKKCGLALLLFFTYTNGIMLLGVCMRVNKAELAQILGVSLPTIAAYLVRYGDMFPILERGSRGRDYWFDHEAVVDFLQGRRAADAEADSDRQAAIRQFALPFGHNGGPPLQPEIPHRPADLLALMKVRKLHREEAYACGLLVKAADVGASIAELLRELNRHQHQMVRQFGRQEGLSDDQTARLDTALSTCQRKFVAYMQSIMAERAAQPSLFAQAAE